MRKTPPRRTPTPQQHISVLAIIHGAALSVVTVALSSSAASM
jgi:hypothetical protein